MIQICWLIARAELRSHSVHGDCRTARMMIIATVIYLGAAVSSARGTTITDLNGTGVNYSATAGTPDANWSVVALPVSFTSGTQTPSYPAWIFSGGGGSTNVPSGWLGGSSNTGTNGYHWIGVRNNDTSALLSSGTTGDYYSVIFATQFNASAAGVATLSLGISVDNRATVFVGGSITGVGTDRPTIADGQQIGGLIWNTNPPNGTPRAFEQLQTASGVATLVEGPNTLYVVVDDYISVPGATTFGSMGLLVSPIAVPEPSTYALALTALVACGWRVCRRRRTTSDMTQG